MEEIVKALTLYIICHMQHNTKHFTELLLGMLYLYTISFAYQLAGLIGSENQ